MNTSFLFLLIVFCLGAVAGAVLYAYGSQLNIQITTFFEKGMDLKYMSAQWAHYINKLLNWLKQEQFFN